ncbi:tyrosine-type recombinase/integrase [Clostridiisalibacter paucivorans]|uniref:tyrosine-type recombinase/integrase n=1 Tax=Clostridiisalibacter paucivorans TaxID=408753 RepID=UPI0004793AEA|nr:tyrosine-type recombinase/integrase [Clostridiisalibacter paucivorans]
MKINIQKDFSDKSFKEGFKDFIRYCKVRNLSSSTLRYYNTTVDKFTEFFNEDNPINIITEGTIHDYILYLREESNCNNISINTHLRGIRAILYYFMNLNYMKKFKIKMLKAEKKIKETYSDRELEILLKKPNLKKCKFNEYRNWVLINYLLATGNRANTIVNLKIKDLDFEGGYIHLTTTKNRRQQIIPMSKKLSRILIEYLQYRGSELDNYLFPNAYNKQLTVNGLGQAIRKYNLKRGVPKTSLHLFRHTFAKKWILAGGDIFRLQKILGHSTLDVVKEYVNMFAEDLVDDFDKLNTLDQITSSGKDDYITLNKGGRR